MSSFVNRASKEQADYPTMTIASRLTIGIWLTLVFLPSSFANCNPRCAWMSWEQWGSCSESCGGGYRTRTRGICCDKDADYDVCVVQCRKDRNDASDYGACNTNCHHGGTFYYDHYDVNKYTFDYGHCICPQKFGGDCCDLPNCGWDGKWCWPGSCSPRWYFSSDTTNYERDCRCDWGFRREKIGSTTKCQLDSSMAMSRPTLETCRTGLENIHRDAVNTTTIGLCSDARSIYTNLQPAKLSFTIESSFSINNSSDPKKNRIKHWSFGIVENTVKVVKKSLTGSPRQLDTKSLQGAPTCNVPFSDRNPHPMIVSCSGELTHVTSLSDGESICVDFIAHAGGFLTTQDSVTDTYKRTENHKELCFKYDDSAPTHCVGSQACSASMLHLDHRITSNPDIHVTFSNWIDPIPAGGSSSHASGISKFIVELLRVNELDKTTLEMKYPSLKTKEMGPYESSTDIALPNEPALYTVVLEVHDGAGNVGRARRFVLYDNSSTVALFGDKNLWSSSASSQTNYTWQTHHGPTCFNWTGRYYNTYHLNFNLLRALKKADTITADYDQTTGPMSVSGTPNIDGIVRFDYAWKLNNQSYKQYKTVGNLFSQSVCEDLKPSDGTSYTFQIKPVDINSRYLTEEYVLHVDRSPPDIDNIWLLKDGFRQLFIHNSSDLSKMKLQFEALDMHSGLSGSIQWALGTDDGGSDIGNGFIAVHKVDGPCIKQECYCPNVGKCENYVYTINLNALVANNTHKGQHNREYFFTVVVTNNAGLINIEHMDILADDSPPERGVIKEGDTGTPDIDYTSEDEIIVSWSGFIDHESGIKFYMVAIAPECLSKDDLHYSSDKKVMPYHPMIHQTKETTAKFKVDEDGFYRSSVIAYNNAMEPSTVACSDGFSRDSTKPTISNLTIKHSKTSEVLACDSQGPWLIRTDLKRIPLQLTAICAERCTRTPSIPFLETLIIEMENNNDTDIADDLCLRLPNYTDNWYIYIPSDKLDISWVAEDNDTQIRSEEIGFASDPSTIVTPDIEAYVPVNGHSRYHKNHEGIAAGRPFFVSVRVTNKANIDNVVYIGPVVIDETEPAYTDGLNVSVDKFDDKIYCFWRNDSFIDTEQKKVVDFVIYRIGSGDKFYTPMLQVPPGQRCPRQEMFDCVHYPLHKLQRQDEEKGLSFYFELYVHNIVGHFTTVRSDLFTLPSRYVPGHGTVLDIEPSKYVSNKLANDNRPINDIKVHFVANVLCATWSGFYHHQDVQFEVGIGTNKNTDNVIRFSSVSSENNSHCFNSSTLLNDIQYFFLVKATCSAGSVIVSSDGVTILDRHKAAKEIKSYIGYTCENAASELLETMQNMTNNEQVFKSTTKLDIGYAYTLEIYPGTASDIGISSDDVLWLEDIRIEGTYFRREFRSLKDYPSFAVMQNSTTSLDNATTVRILHCSQRILAHSSAQTLSAFWTINPPVSGLVDSLHVSLIRNNCKEPNFLIPDKHCTSEAARVRRTPADHNVTFSHLALIDQTYYSVKIQGCFGSVCLPSMFSRPVVVQYLPPSLSITQASIQRIEDKSVEVLLKWKPSDCLTQDNTTASAMYEWTLALGDDADGPLTPWFIVKDSDTIKHQDILQVTDCVPIDVYAHRQMYACIKTMCLSGVISTTCSPLDTPHPNEYQKTHVYEVDANSPRFQELKTKLHARFLGDTLKELHELDLDFCRRNATLAGVIPSPTERNFTWYLTTSAIVPRSLQCDTDPACIKSLTSQGGYAIFHKVKLSPGKTYYICVWSNATIIKRELFDEHLDEVRLCGNGFLVDDMPPIAGQVQVVNQRHGFLLGSAEIAVAWDGFKDLASYNHNSTIKGYSIAIGTLPRGTDVLPYTPVGHVHYTKVNNISLTNGYSYYASVKAIDHVGLSSVAISVPVTLDTTPPDIGSITVGGHMKHLYLLSSKQLRIHWTGFEDKESGIDKFFVGVGDLADIDNVKGFVEVSDQYADMSCKVFVDGKTYIAVLKVINKAGLWSTLSSEPFVLDSSPPSGGVVRDGELSTEGDIDFQNFTSSLSCHWEGFNDPHSGIHVYSVGLGTSPNTFDIFELTSIGLKTEQTWTSHLIPGVKYFATVESCNGAGLCTRRYSDGVIMDDSPPIQGLVHVGFSGQHDKYHSHRNSISAQWVGFEDPHSGLNHFEYCLTTTSSQCNIASFTNVLLSKSVFKSQLSLPLAQDIYIRVMAYNNVGMVTEAISDSFQVDDSPPILIDRPQFVLRDMQISHRNGTQWDNSLLRLAWNFTDPESPVTRHIVKLHTHHDGKALKHISQFGNENHITIKMEENELLKNGDRYTATVTACNAAGLCTSSTSEDLLVDSSKPHLGGFKPLLTWENNGHQSTILVTWYGFSDVESGIERYFIAVSKDYSGFELSNGVIAVDANHETEQNTTLTLKEPIKEGDRLILSIWATNNAGLRSDIGKVTVRAIKTDSSGLRGTLKLQKHSCTSHFCNNDCTCAVVGKKCEPLPSAASCVDVGKNATRFPDVDVLAGMHDYHQKYTASSSCLTGHWTTTSNNTSVLRYEWSMGILNDSPGAGFFNAQNEPTWYDVGYHTNVTYCLPYPKSLVHGESYIIYVKAWYSETESKVFESLPIIVDLTAPMQARGRTVYESIDGCSTDVEFIVDASIIEICWQGVFRESNSRILKFDLMAGSFPYGDDLIPLTEYGLATNATFRNLALHQGTRYYFTLRAVNTVGLQTSVCSDGIVLDTTRPYTGVVYNTDRYRNTHFQPTSDSFSMSWHGFGDHHSHIHHYSVWVTDKHTNKTIAREDVGIRSSFYFKNLRLEQNHAYVGSVQAWDAAGHGSEVARSPLVKVDVTPPISFECRNYTELTLLKNESLESDISLNVNLSKCALYKLVVTVKEHQTTSTLQVSIGMHGMVLPLAEKADGTNEGQHVFMSTNDGFTNITISPMQASDNIATIVKLSECLLENVTSAKPAVDVRQIGPYELSIFPRVIDPESDIRSLQLGIGTTKTGFQIRSLSSIPTGVQIKIDFNAMHGSSIYTTVIAYNNAGLRSSFYGKEITVDHDPPVIANATAEMALSAKENATDIMSAVVNVKFSCDDEQSGVQYCLCRLDSEAVSADRRLPTGYIQYECLFNDVEVRHGSVLKTNIHCVNNVELSSSMMADPLTVSFNQPSTPSARVEIIPKSKGLINNADFSGDDTVVQDNLTCIHAQWFGFEDITGVSHYRLTLKNNESAILTSMNTTSSRNTVELHGLRLRDGQVYMVEVQAINNGGVYSDPVSASVRTDSRQPKLTGLPVKHHLEGASVDLDWSDVFETDPHMSVLYDVNVGRRTGYADVFARDKIKFTSVRIPVNLGSGSIWISIRGYHVTGKDAYYRDIVYF